MKMQAMSLNEYFAQEAFSRQSVIFDDLYAGNTIVQYKRSRVRGHVLKNLSPGSNILELNSGTGDDALFFAKMGYPVHATDISTGMQAMLKDKVKAEHLSQMVSSELCSFTKLDELKKAGPYDLIFSNFAGLNCTAELDKVLSSFASLVKPGGMVTLVMLPKFCFWETLLVFKGKFKTATRRFFSKNGVTAHLEGTYFKCYYYNPSYIINRLKKDFELMEVEGLCTIVPPSYIEDFAEKHPVAYRILKRWEDRWKAWWPFRNIGDYYIISLNRIIPQ